MSGLLDRLKSLLLLHDEDDFEPADADDYGTVSPRRKRGLIRLSSRSGEIFLRRPRTQDEARICVDCLRGRSAVIVNLKDVQPEHASRVFDFLLGATYALGGQLEQAGDGVYLLTPHGIGIMSEDEAETPPGSSFWQEI
jgi:cell division inhibitor SepF